MKNYQFTVSDLKGIFSLCFSVVIRNDCTLEIIDTVSDLYSTNKYDDYSVNLVTINSGDVNTLPMFEIWVTK